MHSIDLGEDGRVRFDGNGMQVELSVGIEPGVRREIDEGLVSGLSSHLAGMLVVHASAVRWGDAVVALMGDQGVGKSSLSLACSLSGAHPVSDGMTVVDPATLLVRTGLQRWKLTDESIAAMKLRAADYEFVNGYRRKRYVPFPVHPSERGGRLNMAFWLSLGDQERIEELAPREQLMALVSNAYLGQELPINEQEQLLARAAQVLSQGVEVRRLVCRQSWDALDATVRLIQRAVT